MCGIAGWVDWERDLSKEQVTVERMGQTLACRGPDTDASFVSHSAAFAHRRLIVVDPKGGAQPMRRTVGGFTYTMVYNGELYNTEDIRQALLSEGFNFQSYSDTEVLLTAYIAWGTECVHRFNGIFAFAIWDERERRLFMARDRLGVKPLFYARKNSGLFFASELKAILAHPEVEPLVAADGLAEIFAIGPARTPGHGIFKDIHELRPGHRLIANKQKVQVEQYWRLESHEHPDDIDTTVAKVRELMIDTVSRQLVSDVPVSTFLSGGLDSSAVSAIAAQIYKDGELGPLHTYSIEFEDMAKHFQANNFQKSIDAPWARYVSEYLGTIHHSIVFTMEEMVQALLDQLPFRDIPGMADIDTSMYLFCREVKRHHTVALTGEAADEVFGGYPWFHRQESLSADTFPWSLRLSERMKVMSNELQHQIHPEEYVATRYREALAEVDKLPGEDAEQARIREIGYLSITRFLPTLLDRKDRMSMGASLEARVPFTDHRLVEYVYNVPWSIKTLDDEIKGLLRRAMKGFLPEDALYRKKSPYPGTPNPEYLAAVRARMNDILLDSTSPILPLINVSSVRDLIDSSYGPLEHRPWFGQILATPQMFHYLIEINEWLKTYHVQLI